MNILTVDGLGRDAKGRVAEMLFGRLVSKCDVITDSGYFDTYDMLCAEEEAMGRIFIGSVSNHESTDVYYHSNGCVSIIRCLTGYKDDDTYSELRIDVSNLISALKNNK